MHPRVTASIVVYKNSFELVGNAVRSFLESCPDGTVYLIDNSPRNTIGKHFKSEHRVIYIFNNCNLGFGAGHNIAIRKSLESGARYHVVLNPDVSFESQVIPQLVAHMDANPDTGLTMPKVLYPDGRIQHLCKLLPSPENLFIRRFFPFNRYVFARLHDIYELKFSGYDKIMDVPCLSGCFMMLRNESLRKVGLFDEKIFLYTEDYDLSRRIHRHYRTVFYPGVSICHIHERGSYKRLIPFLFHIISAVTYFNKWGWFRDPERELFNRIALIKLNQ